MSKYKFFFHIFILVLFKSCSTNKNTREVPTLIYTPKLIIMANEQGKTLEGYSLLVKEGKILKIKKTKKLYKENKNITKVIKNVILLPSFINTHTHLSNTGMYRYTKNKTSVKEWFKESFKLEKCLQSRQYAKNATIIGALTLLQSGVSTFNDMSFYSEEVNRSLKELGLYGITGETLLDAKTPSYHGENEGLAIQEKLSYKNKNEDMIGTSFSPLTTNSLSNNVFRKILAQNTSERKIIHMHWGEFKSSIKNKLNSLIKKNTSHKTSFILAHGIHNDKTMDYIFKNTPSSLSINITSNLNMRLNTINISRYKTLNTNITIGTDSSLSNPDLNYFNELKNIYKLIRNRDWKISAKEIIKWATLNGAKSLSLSSKLGLIKEGMDATFLTINIPKRIENNDIYKYIVETASKKDINDLYIKGTPFIKSGQLKPDLKKRLRESNIKLEQIKNTQINQHNCIK